MAEPRKRSRRKGVGRRRKTREKLDPRFDWLLSLSERKRERLVREEAGRLVEVEKALAAHRAGKSSERGKEASEKRRQQLDDMLFSPLSTGIHLPKLDRRLRIRRPYASVFIRSEASDRDLKRLGARVRTRSSSVVTAFIPLHAIDRLEESAAVDAIELARPLHPTLDQTLPYAGVDALQAGPPARSGAGVVVGIIDTVLDVHHPDFRTAGGQSRVLYLWDQTLTPRGGETGPPTGPDLPGFTPASGTTYGVEYDIEDINEELSRPAGDPPYKVVRHGGEVAAHGTHVTGIAAGNGLAGSVPPRPGAAPDAGIVFVATPRLQDTAPLADSTAVADGMSYIFARAKELDRPAVINLSNSDNQGPHDATSLGESFIDGLLTVPGRALTVSAGNSNGRGSHAAGTVALAGTADVVLNYRSPTEGNRSDDIEFWYDGHDRFAMTVTAPDGTVIGPLAAGAGTTTATLSNGVELTLTSTVGDPRNGDNVISLISEVPSGQNLDGDWTFSLRGDTVVNGRFEAWVDRNNRFYRWFKAPFRNEHRMTLGVPATCRHAITVGNHERTTTPPAISATSGRGPSRDGRVKPDLATVGTDVNAPRSRNAALADPGPFYVSMDGTSMSAPLVAGALALLFECRGPAMTWFDLLQVLQGSARRDMPERVPAVPNDAFGYGWMQAAEGCTAAAGKVDVWLKDDPGDVGAEPSGAAIFWASPDIEVLDASGNPVPNPTHDPDNRFSNRIRVTARNRGSGTARNVEAYLYWADPGTNIPFPAEWRSDGIYAGAAPNFPDQTNRIVIPQIAAGGSAQVEFAWAPPAPGSGVAGDDHFCLLARLEHPADPSQVVAGGFPVISARNNLGLRNVHVQPNATGGDSETAFEAIGTGDGDVLYVTSNLIGGRVRLALPAMAIPWRDARLITRRGRRQTYGCGGSDAFAGLRLTAKGGEVEERTGIIGAQAIEVEDGIALVTLSADRMLVPDLRAAAGVRVPIRVLVNGIRTKGERRFVHVAQLAGGRRLGGVALELRKGLHRRRAESRLT